MYISKWTIRSWECLCMEIILFLWHYDWFNSSKSIWCACTHTTFYVYRKPFAIVIQASILTRSSKWIVCFTAEEETGCHASKSESMSGKKTHTIRWITETVAQPFIRFRIRTVHIPFDYRHSCRVWVLLVASSLKSDWHRLLVWVCAAVFGVISSCDVGWYIFRLICSRNTFFLRCVYICVSAINAMISLAFTRNHWWAALYICTSLAFDAYGTHKHKQIQ